MHRAPAVNFTVNRSRWHARLIACMGLLALAVFVVFARGQASLDARTLVLGLTIFATTGFALLGWKRSAEGNLRWDGQHWYWSGFDARSTCHLVLLMDFQHVVLVSVQTESRPKVHLWLEATPGNTNWRPLRRALVSSQAGSGDGHRTVERTHKGDPA